MLREDDLGSVGARISWGTLGDTGTMALGSATHDSTESHVFVAVATLVMAASRSATLLLFMPNKPVASSVHGRGLV